jgi:hypothetical protein
MALQLAARRGSRSVSVSEEGEEGKEEEWGRVLACYRVTVG